jgi:hypothetical protein
MRIPILAVCLLLAATAACSTHGDGEPVASVGGSAAASPTPSLSVIEQGRRHAQCMREHGVPEPDPQVFPDGTVRIGGELDKARLGDTLTQAMAACKAYEVVESQTDRDTKAAKSREYSRCMRAHGVEDFPDPAADGRVEVPESIRSDPGYEPANRTCVEVTRSYEP